MVRRTSDRTIKKKKKKKKPKNKGEEEKKQNKKIYTLYFTVSLDQNDIIYHLIAKNAG